MPYLIEMGNLAVVGKKQLEKGDLHGFARTMEQEWTVKKNLTTITDDEIETMYKKALKAGAWGGRVSGAGMGGFLTLLVPPGKKSSLFAAFKNSVVVTPKIVTYGSRILVDD